MRPKLFNLDFDNVDADGLAQAQAVGSAKALTLNGALISGGAYASVDGLGHQIGILSAADDHSITFTVVGTDPDGHVLTEVVTGASAAPGTAETAGYFKTVASVTSSAAAAGNVSVGTVDEVSTQTIMLDRMAWVGASIDVDVTGTVNCTVQETVSDVQAGVTPHWNSISALASKTADTVSTSSVGMRAIRLIVNSFTDTAEIQLTVAQPFTQ